MTPSLTDLRNDLAHALRSVPGARALIEFGSVRGGTSDEFSDVDFQLLVDDCAAALPAFLSTIGEVVAPELEWTISDDRDHYWLMALPDSTRPWFKVDIGLDPYNSGNPADLGWTGQPLWTQEAPAAPTARANAPTWPRPAPGTIDNFVVWQLIDLGRLAKFSYRQKPLNMLKLLSQLTKATVIVESVRLGGHDDFDDVPSTASLAALDQSEAADLTDMNAPLVDHIHALSRRLYTAIVNDEPLRRSCERMVAASDAILRERTRTGRYPSTSPG